MSKIRFIFLMVFGFIDSVSVTSIREFTFVIIWDMDKDIRDIQDIRDKLEGGIQEVLELE
ncbi:hypothetical protein CVS40_7492 [Lucilia cuprina]|nr:hypothetical protein CVS40_7492 [Lucilia cuprina]